MTIIDPCLDVECSVCDWRGLAWETPAGCPHCRSPVFRGGYKESRRALWWEGAVRVGFFVVVLIALAAFALEAVLLAIIGG